LALRRERNFSGIDDPHTIIGVVMTLPACRVFVVHPDAVSRVSIARAIVSGGFDVASLRASDELAAALAAEVEGGADDGRMIILIDLDEPAIASILREVTAQHPRIGVIARTHRGPIDAEVMLSAVELDRSVIVARAASEAELLDAARRIALKISEG
jgi:hypothetical protein